jgi:hypothetical protein
MAITAHFYSPFSHCSIIDSLSLFSLENFFTVVGTTTVAAIGFFFDHLFTSGPPNRLVLFNSCAPLAVPLVLYFCAALGTRGARLPDFPGVPV